MEGDSIADSALGWLAALWGCLGVILIISNGIYRVFPMAVGAFEHSLSVLQWGMLVIWSAFMLHSEGYKGFQKAFSPRVGARARWLREHPTPMRSLLAPFFCMGFFGATRKRKLVAWILTTAIIGFILLIKLLPQPWRGIIDVGVVLGLSWGLASLLYFCWQGLFQADYDVDPEVGRAELALQGPSPRVAEA